MKLFKFFLVLILLAIPLQVYSQVVGPLQDRFDIISQNSVSTIAAFGDTVWVSPLLNRNIGNNFDWFTPENADSVVDGRGRAFSIALGKDTVV